MFYGLKPEINGFIHSFIHNQMWRQLNNRLIHLVFASLSAPWDVSSQPVGLFLFTSLLSHVRSLICHLIPLSHSYHPSYHLSFYSPVSYSTSFLPRTVFMDYQY